MKNKSIIVFSVLLVSSLILFVFRNKLLGRGPSGSLSGETNTSGNQPNYLLSSGSRGDQVKLVQAYMVEYHGAKLIVDGIWGAKTQAGFESLVSKVNFLSSPGGITKEEYKYFQPHLDFLSKKYFNQK